MIGRIGQFLKTQVDSLLALVAAAGLALLSVLDKIDPEDLSAATLGVLAVVSVTIVKDRQVRAGDARQSAQILNRVTSLQEATDFAVVVPDDIGRVLSKSWQTTKRWRFKGGTGTYLRAATLPGLALRENRLNTDVWVEILAPDDEGVCERYGVHRSRGPNRSTKNGTDDWGANRVRIQSYATIVAAIWYTQYFKMRVNVALTSVISTLRYDLSDDFVMITREDPDARALSIRGGDSSYFASTERELDMSFNEGRVLGIQKAKKLPRNEIGADDVRAVLRQLSGLNNDGGFLDGHEVCEKIALMAISREQARRLGLDHGDAVNPYPTRA